jgi:hypothetical protein
VGALEAALRDARSSSTGWWRAHCPFCEDRKGKADHKRSLAINVASGRYVCWRCNARGRVDPSRVLGHAAVADAKTAALRARLVSDVLGPPPRWIPLDDQRAMQAASLTWVYNYLASRGVTMQPVIEARIGVSLDSLWFGSVIVPLLDAEQVWRGWIARLGRFMGSVVGPKYRYPIGMRRGDYLWNEGALLRDTRRPAYVVEGVFDALPHWPHACACLGKPTQAQYEKLLVARRPLAIVLDRDAQRDTTALLLQLQHDGKEAFPVYLPRNVKDPGELTSAQLKTITKAAQKQHLT